MTIALLKHHVLALKNRFLYGRADSRARKSDFPLVVLLILIMYAIYAVLSSFLQKVCAEEGLGDVLAERLMSVSLYSFFLLLLFSNFISGLGNLSSEHDLGLFLTLPISRFHLFSARLIEIIANSSWMFLVFAFPSVVAYADALHLPWMFLLVSGLLAIPLLVIPSALAITVVLLLVNLIPAYRMKELLSLFTCVCVGFFLYFGMHLPPSMGESNDHLRHAVYALAMTNDPIPPWSPSSWASKILASFLPSREAAGVLPLLLLLSTMCGTFALGYLSFDLMFLRGWNLSLESARSPTPHRTLRGLHLAQRLFPCAPQLRAMMYKELRTFIRDTTQSVQLLFLLMLTFVYLYNFRALQTVVQLRPTIQHWWDLILCLSNIALGSCIVSAIATRLVFPSLSLEGRSYTILRAAPISLEGLLWSKYLIWLGPTALIAGTLLVSGAWAIGVSPGVVVLSAILAVALTLGIVGLGVGIGAVYARFDWNNPTEVSASFGSLVFMFACLLLLFVTLIPASVLLACASIPAFIDKAATVEYSVVFGCGLLLVFTLTGVATRKAVQVGAESLRDRER